jgi:hypothetical protein
VGEECLLILGLAQRRLGHLRVRTRAAILFSPRLGPGNHAVVSCTVRHNLRSRAVMERIGMRYVGEIYSRGSGQGEDEERDDAPFAVCLMLAGERSPLTFG